MKSASATALDAVASCVSIDSDEAELRYQLDGDLFTMVPPVILEAGPVVSILSY